MMLLGYLIPGIGFSEREKARRQHLLDSEAGRNLAVTLHTIGNGPQAIESAEDERKAVPHLMDLVLRIHGEMDGLIIGCFGDPGIEEIRRVTPKPVIGPLRASCWLASNLGDSATIITLDDAVLRDRIEALGFRETIDLVSLKLPVLTVVDDPGFALDCFEKEAKKAHGEVIIPGCMSLAFQFLERNIRTMAGKKIVNPVAAAVGLARMMLT